MSAEVRLALPQVTLFSHTLAYCQAVYRLSRLIGQQPTSKRAVWGYACEQAGVHFERQVGVDGLSGLWDHLSGQRSKPTASSRTR